jgi:hypothetical protein
MNKFKPGDRVVYCNPLDRGQNESVKPGMTGTVADDSNVPLVKMDSDVNTHKNHYCFLEEELILEVIYNSPLMQALTEKKKKK